MSDAEKRVWAALSGPTGDDVMERLPTAKRLYLRVLDRVVTKEACCRRSLEPELEEATVLSGGVWDPERMVPVWMVQRLIPLPPGETMSVPVWRLLPESVEGATVWLGDLLDLVHGLPFECELHRR